MLDWAKAMKKTNNANKIVAILIFKRPTQSVTSSTRASDLIGSEAHRHNAAKTISKKKIGINCAASLWVIFKTMPGPIAVVRVVSIIL